MATRKVCVYEMTDVNGKIELYKTEGIMMVSGDKDSEPTLMKFAKLLSTYDVGMPEESTITLTETPTENKHIGQNFDDFLKEDGILDEVNKLAQEPSE